MEKLGDLMRRLGFREEASFETKKAFIRNLAKAAAVRPEVAQPAKEEQLSFDFERLELESRKSG